MNDYINELIDYNQGNQIDRRWKYDSGQIHLAKILRFNKQLRYSTISKLTLLPISVIKKHIYKECRERAYSDGLDQEHGKYFRDLSDEEKTEILQIIKPHMKEFKYNEIIEMIENKEI